MDVSFNSREHAPLLHTKIEVSLEATIYFNCMHATKSLSLLLNNMTNER